MREMEETNKHQKNRKDDRLILGWVERKIQCVSTVQWHDRDPTFTLLLQADMEMASDMGPNGLPCIPGQPAFVVCINSRLRDPHSWSFTTEALLTAELQKQEISAATNKHYGQSCAAPTFPPGSRSMCLLISALLQRSCVKLLNSHLI